MSLIERLKLESELKSTVSIGKLFQRFMTRSAKKLLFFCTIFLIKLYTVLFAFVTFNKKD